MNEPKAIEPKWYRNTQQRPVDTDPEPLESDVLVKYQIAQVAEITN